MKRVSFKKRFFLILAASFLVFKLTDERHISGVQAETLDADQAKPELVMQTGHSKAIGAVVFSPDNKWIASGGFDDTIKIWEAERGRELRSLTGHNGPIKSLAWSSDGRWLVSGSIDKTVKLWNVADGQEIRPFGGFNEAVEAVAFSQNGQMIAAGSADQSIRIWETESGRESKTLTDIGGRITALAFSPDGLFLAAGISDNTIKVWEIGKDKKPRTLKNHTERIKTIAFSPDGKLLASGAFDNTVRIWKTVNGSKAYQFTGHNEKVLALQFLSNTEIISADAKRNIKFWNPADGGETRKAAKETGDDELTEADAAAFSSDGNLSVFSLGDRTAAIFEAASGKQISKMENHILALNSAAFSSDKKWLAVASIDNTIKIWDLDNGQSLPPLAGHSAFVRSVSFTPDNQKIVSASKDGTIKLWNFTTGGATQTLVAHPDGVNSVAVSSKGKWLVSGGFDKTVKIWDLKAPKDPQILIRHDGEVESVAISPDENLVASGSVDKTVKIWNLSLQKEMKPFTDHTDTVESVAFSPDGKLLASASADKTVKIRDVASGQVLKTFSGHSGKIKSISFSPDSKWIAYSGDDKTVRLRDISGEQKEKIFEGHSGTVNSVSFDSDGKFIVSASDDGSVNIWQTNATSSLATLLSLRENNDWLVVSPKGFFDGSTTAWNQLLWRFSGKTFNFSPVEIFYNEFYQPGLLEKLLKGKQLDVTGDISQKDRRQPQLRISLADGKSPTGKIADRNVRLKIEVAEIPPANSNEKGSGAKDVRLFRNGSLVRLWEDDVLKGRSSGKITLEQTVPIVEGVNEFTAYAFNSDDIKSSDENLTVIGAENLKRKGMIYIFAIGVGQYANPEFNLSYIESDVQLFGEILQKKQSELDYGDRIKVLPLLDKDATKKNIRQTLKALAGITEGASQLPFPELPQKVQPEDTVIVYFSGHGIALEKRFYMIPYDLGYMGKREKLFENDGLKTLTSSSISDLELQEAFRGIDAKNLLLIVDACRSGQALETEEKRQGPMNSKGLAQLAYEKGMYILTASQSAEDAYVSGVLKHSYLTYALVEEGLNSARADNNPADGQLLLREWFDYAGVRVPQMRQEEVKKEIAAKKGLEEVTVTKKETSGVADSDKGQSPRIFYRRYMEQQPWVVARVAAAKQ